MLGLSGSERPFHVDQLSQNQAAVCPAAAFFCKNAGPALSSAGSRGETRTMKTERWCCSVCGYLHIGESAPDCCPVCGATAELFEPSVTVISPPDKIEAYGWRCINCDFIHEGDAAPDLCPVCGVGADQFEAVAQEKQSTVTHAVSGDIVIIGGGIAGLSAAEAARNSAPAAAITLITQEPVLPYYRLNLTRYLAGEITAAELPIHPALWYAERNITVLTGTEVTAIDRSSKTVVLKGCPARQYDKLVLATGAHPSVFPIAGTHRKNIFTLRTIRDAEAILGFGAAGTKCVVVGGGVLGLEIAAALVRRQVQVSLVEGFDWLLPRQTNRTAGERLAAEAGKLGINLVCGGRIKQFDGDEQVRSVALESGEELSADMVIIATGVRSNTYLARMALLDVNDGVVVDSNLRTSDPDIFAAGDLAEHQGIAYGTWAPSQFQGTIAGMNAAGCDVIFAGIPRSNSLKVLGVDMFSIGHVRPEDASYRVFEEAGERYDFFVFRDSRLTGAILIGDTAIAPTLKKLIETGVSCSELLDGACDASGIRAGISLMR